jgi:hypothetical protein
MARSVLAEDFPVTGRRTGASAVAGRTPAPGGAEDRSDELDWRSSGFHASDT